MFPAVDIFFAAADFALPLGNLELAVQNIFGADAGLIPPSRRGKGFLLDHLLDDGLDRRRLGELLDEGWAGRANLRCRRGRGQNAARSTSKNFSFPTSNLCLALSDVALARDKCLRPFGSKDAPHTTCVGFARTVAGDSLGGGERKHHREHGEDERQDEEEGCGGDGAVVVVARGGTFRALALSFSMRRGGLGHPDAD